MIAAAGGYTISAVVVRDGDWRYRCSARAFNHPNPEKVFHSEGVARHVVTAEGASPEAAARALEDALAKLLGPLDWVRWRYTHG
jgi:hypothetical protein